MVCHTNKGEIIGTVSQEKWEKTQSLVLELAEMVEEVMTAKGQYSEVALVLWHRLLEIQGYLNYVVRTYNWMSPFMKGFHDTFDGWRYNRDGDGLKLRGKQLQTMLVEKYQMDGLCRCEHDERVGVTNI